MDKFSFFKSLNEAVAEKAEAERSPRRPKLTEGIKYDEYDVTMYNGKIKTVYIPVRRTDIFESELENSSLLTEDAIRSILRKCNGVTEI